MAKIISKFFIFLATMFYFACFSIDAYADCNPGCYEVQGQGICMPCPSGTYSEDGRPCISCPAGQTGNIPEGATYCIEYKTLKGSNGKSFIFRAEKTVTPSLNARFSNGVTYYGNVSTIFASDFKMNDGSQTYSLVEPLGRPADTCGTPQPAEFQITLAGIPANGDFSFHISARGDFEIDWGDGSAPQIVTRAVLTLDKYAHTYTAGGNYTVKLSGRATGYNSNTNIGAIAFNNSDNRDKIIAIAGDLGGIFPIIRTPVAGSVGTPRFFNTFMNCTGITGTIPGGLFRGLFGAPTSNMFYGTFQGCTGITGVGSGLFGGIVGAPANGTYRQTFSGCTNLQNVPADLFSGLQGTPNAYIFFQTFLNCSNLSMNIPSNFFGGIYGPPSIGMFQETFSGCRNLTGNIPPNLFGNIIGAPQAGMFQDTFFNCEKLTGTLPPGLFANISGAPASNMYHRTFMGCKGLTGNIPPGFFGALNGAPASAMFFRTFSGCTGLDGNIPSNLFGVINGPPVSNMFYGTFENCSGLQSIGNGLFDGITNAALGANSFAYTFFGASKLTGPSATSDGQYLYEKWPSATTESVGCYRGATGLNDWSTINTLFPNWR